MLEKAFFFTEKVNKHEATTLLREQPYKLLSSRSRLNPLNLRGLQKPRLGKAGKNGKGMAGKSFPKYLIKCMRVA